MPKFTDSKGTEWVVTLTVGMIEAIRDDADVNLDSIMTKPEALAETIFAAPKRIVQILWVVCREQAEKLGMDGRAFGFRFDRDTLDRAGEAFLEALVLFYPRSSAGRAIRDQLPALLAKMDREIVTKTQERMRKALSDTATDSPG